MIKKHISNIKKMYIYFEFVGQEEWEDFDPIFRAVAKMGYLGYRVIRQSDYIWSRIAECAKNETYFELLYHEDCGIVLCNSEKQSDEYYAKLGEIAEEIDSKLGNSGAP